jgi:hypothetical protein
MRDGLPMLFEVLRRSFFMGEWRAAELDFYLRAPKGL